MLLALKTEESDQEQRNAGSLEELGKPSKKLSPECPDGDSVLTTLKLLPSEILVRLPIYRTARRHVTAVLSH